MKPEYSISELVGVFSTLEGYRTYRGLNEVGVELHSHIMARTMNRVGARVPGTGWAVRSFR